MRVMVVYGTSDRELELRSIVFTGGYGSSGAGLFISNGARVELLMCSIEQNEGREDGGGISLWDSSTRVNLYGVSFSGNTSPDGPDIHRDGGIITVYTTCTPGGDVAVQGSALSTAGTVGGSKFSYTCGFHWVSTQPDLYNTISMDGTALMTNGDTVTVSSGNYAAGSAYDSARMFLLGAFYGDIQCENDYLSCEFSGSAVPGYTYSYVGSGDPAGSSVAAGMRPASTESDELSCIELCASTPLCTGAAYVTAANAYHPEHTCYMYSSTSTSTNGVAGFLYSNVAAVARRRILWVYGTGGNTLELRGIAFSQGSNQYGGAVLIQESARVQFVMCSFKNNDGERRGGAIYVSNSNDLLTLYGTLFSGNTSPEGADIYSNGGTVTVHLTCSDGGDVAVQQSALSTVGTIGGELYSYICPVAWEVSAQPDLYNKISMDGTALMTNGDTVVVASGNYAAGSAHNSLYMFRLDGLYGSIRCEADDLSCEFDGSGTKTVMVVDGTSGSLLELRSIVFTNGYDIGGAGLWIGSSAQVSLVMCSIQQNEGTNHGGGIYVTDSVSVVNLYGVSFSDNTSPDGADIYNSGTITIHSTCSAGEIGSVWERSRSERGASEQEGEVEDNALRHCVTQCTTLRALPPLCSHMCARDVRASLLTHMHGETARRAGRRALRTSDWGKNKSERHLCVLSRAVYAARTELRDLTRRFEKCSSRRAALLSCRSCSHIFIFIFCSRRRSSPGIRSLHCRRSRRRSILVRLPAPLYNQRRR